MSRSIRRVAALAATVSLVAIVALGATPNARAGIVVQSASVTITKVTDPAVDPQDFVFSVNDSPFFIAVDTDPTSLDFTNSNVQLLDGDDLGTYTIVEGTLSDWTLTDIQCSGDEEVQYDVANKRVVLDVDNGEDIVCTFYNTKRAQLTLEKETIPGNNPQDFNFDLTGGAVPADYTLDTDPNSAFTGSNITWSVWADDLGAYTITEQPAAGWLLFDLVCTGAGDDSSVNLETRTATLDIDGGELVTCTFTNAELPLVTVTKVTVPASDPQDFDFEIPGDRSATLDTDPGSEDVPSSETWSFGGGATLGPRTILETPIAGWTTTDITCTEGSATSTDLEGGSVTIELEEDSNIECVFTNTKDSDETDPPPTDEPTIDPTDETGGESDAPTEPGTSTESKAGESQAVGVGVALVALILLSGVLLLTRPRRAGRK